MTAILPQPPNPLEFYETPGAFTRWLFSILPIRGTILSPCAGSGAIQRHGVPQSGPFQGRSVSGPWTWITNDFDPRWPATYHEDAADPRFWFHFQTSTGIASRANATPIDWVVENPPFAPAIAIIDQALGTARVGVAMHLRASIHEVLKTGLRRTFMAEHPPTAILWLPRFAFQRSPTTGKWTTDSVCTCWCIWMRATTLLPVGQTIQYAPERVLDELQAETKDYRAEMDRLMEGF